MKAKDSIQLCTEEETMGKYIMALDQGTTSSRTILFDKKGNIVCQAKDVYKRQNKNCSIVDAQ